MCSFHAGYIETDDRFGAREGDIVDDYFVPLSEGDKVFEPSAETYYFYTEYEHSKYELFAGYGETEYSEDGTALKERELTLSTEIKFNENIALELETSKVRSDSPEGDFSKYQVEFILEF